MKVDIDYITEFLHYNYFVEVNTATGGTSHYLPGSITEEAKYILQMLSKTGYITSVTSERNVVGSVSMWLGNQPATIQGGLETKINWTVKGVALLNKSAQVIYRIETIQTLTNIFGKEILE